MSQISDINQINQNHQGDLFKVSIQCPFKNDHFDNILSSQLQTVEGSYEFLANHYNFAGIVSFGDCIIKDKNEIKNFNIFNGSVYFDNELNTLNIYCVDYWLTNENITNYENILNIYKNTQIPANEYTSRFKLKFTKEHNISLEVDY